MTKDQEDAIYAAYLGVCVLQTMCRKAGLAIAEQRSKELLTELGTAFPFLGERVALSALRAAPSICSVCGAPLTWKHDHRADNSGLDDGPPLRTPRKRPASKTGEELRDIRARAWATRRKKYGHYGHRP